MKLNNKGFAITLVLYGTLVLFLLLLVSLLGILSTYKLRLEKIYPQQDTDDIQLTCNFTTSFTQSKATVTISVNDETLLNEKPYGYYAGDTWYTSKSHSDSSLTDNKNVYFTVRVKDKKDNIINCGTAFFKISSYSYIESNLACTDTITGAVVENFGGSGTGAGPSGSYTTYDKAYQACKDKCPSGRYTYKSGCSVQKNISVSTTNANS